MAETTWGKFLPSGCIELRHKNPEQGTREEWAIYLVSDLEMPPVKES